MAAMLCCIPTLIQRLSQCAFVERDIPVTIEFTADFTLHADETESECKMKGHRRRIRFGDPRVKAMDLVLRQFGNEGFVEPAAETFSVRFGREIDTHLDGGVVRRLLAKPGRAGPADRHGSF